MCREMTGRVGMEEAVEMVGTAPVIPRDLVAPRSTGCGKQRRRSMEGCLAVVTHICLVPEARDAEGLQQVTATEQQDAKLWKREERSPEVGAQGAEKEPPPPHPTLRVGFAAQQENCAVGTFLL